jgi:hypothetical protein
MALVKVEQGVMKVENYTPVRYATVTVPDIFLVLEGGFLNFFHYPVHSTQFHNKTGGKCFRRYFQHRYGSGSRNAVPDPYAVQPKVEKTSSYQMSIHKTSSYRMSRLPNVHVTKLPFYKTSLVTKRPGML